MLHRYAVAQSDSSLTIIKSDSLCSNAASKFISVQLSMCNSKWKTLQADCLRSIYTKGDICRLQVTKETSAL